MSIKNTHYDRILNIYDARRTRAHFELEERRKKLYAEQPRIRELEDMIIEGSVNRARLALQGDARALEGLAEANSGYAAEKKKLLAENGYPENYLEHWYECPDCKDTGYVNGEQCMCFKKELAKLAWDDSNMRELVAAQNFNSFKVTHYSDDEAFRDPSLGKTPRQQIESILDDVTTYLDRFDEEHGNLYIYGDTGVGKTFLTSCIAKELLDTAHSVMYFPSYSLFEILIGSRMNNGSSEEGADRLPFRVEQIYNAEVLIIDDLGTELPNAMTQAELYSCINERIIRKRATIISTNLSPVTDLQKIYGERLFSRIYQNYTIHKIIGEDIRLKS